jgi:3-methyl-2-oxobutanoate hydroxymethyltransferase
MPERITAPAIRAKKAKGEKVVCVTAYDHPSGRIADEAGVDLILVGDSLGNVVLGYENTLPVTLEQMCHHTSAVARAVKRALLVADLPFGAYESSPAKAVESAVALVKAGASAVKPEGARLEAVEAILGAGIPVMGHVGMTPQAVHAFGGFRLQGKGDAGEAVQQAACALDAAGAFAIVLELIPMALARRISEKIGCPTIGIGAGPHCDGQVQVFHDVLGIGSDTFRHAKRYLEGSCLMRDSLAAFAKEVRDGVFPQEEHGFADRTNEA